MCVYIKFIVQLSCRFIIKFLILNYLHQYVKAKMEIQAKTQQQPQKPLLNPTYMERFMNEQNSKLKLSEEYLFLKVVVGKYFIQAYRVFKMLPKIDSIIFWKRQNNRTHYNFFIIFLSIEHLKMRINGLQKAQHNPVGQMKRIIEKMTRRQLDDYSISISLVSELKKVTFTSLDTYQHFLSSLADHPEKITQKIMSPQHDIPQSQEPQHKQKTQFGVQCFMPKLKKQNEDILFEGKDSFNTLKELMSVYMDTFASEEKGRKIYREIDKSTGSFSVDLLLNTLNYIIFEEVNNSCYSQIEPCYWTCFQSSTKQLNSDRKHIVLTGSGEICVLEIIFLKGLESQSKTEYKMMLAEFKKFYKKAIIKIYRILNEKWNGQVEKIVLEDEPSSTESTSPSIIYKFDCPKTQWQYPSQSKSDN